MISEQMMAEWIEKVSDKNELIASLKVELATVKEERDFLRLLVASFVSGVTAEEE